MLYYNMIWTVFFPFILYENLFSNRNIKFNKLATQLYKMSERERDAYLIGLYVG